MKSIYPDTAPILKLINQTLDPYNIYEKYVDDFQPHLSLGSHPRKESCGDLRSIQLCPDDIEHFHKAVRFTCSRAVCRECHGTWAKRAQMRAAGVIRGYAEAYKERYPPQHISLSPPAYLVDLWRLDCETEQQILKKFLKEANKYSKKMGVKACAAIVHPYRFRDGMKARAQMNSKDNENPYTWAFAQEDWRYYLEFSPHVHFLAYGYLIPSDEFYRNTEWVYRNHGSRDDDLEKTIFYILTHAWVLENNKAVRYWGNMSSTKLGCSVDVYKKYVPCPVCGHLLVDVDALAWGMAAHKDFHECPFLLETVETRTYFIVKKQK